MLKFKLFAILRLTVLGSPQTVVGYYTNDSCHNLSGILYTPTCTTRFINLGPVGIFSGNKSYNRTLVQIRYVQRYPREFKFGITVGITAVQSSTHLSDIKEPRVWKHLEAVCRRFANLDLSDVIWANKHRKKVCTSESSVSIASSICKCQPQAKGIAPDTDILNTEFMYYSAVLRIFATSLIKERDRVNAQLWMRKLFGPTYHSTLLKPKRNKFLLYLTITLYNDETFGIFKEEPPCFSLPDVQCLPFSGECPPAAWEQETQWCDTLNDLPEYFKYSECYLHKTCPEYEECFGAMLDASFNFFLWLIRPYIALMADTEDKTKAACWVQTLCGIGPEKGDCPGLKELRNEYIIALLGYVHDFRVEGPFHEMPPEGPLMTLEDSAKKFRELNPCGGPVGAEAEEFLSHQPLPETGAFAYISVAGSLFKN